MRPLQHPLALRRQPVEALAALDDRHAQFLFELADAADSVGCDTLQAWRRG